MEKLTNLQNWRRIVDTRTNAPSLNDLSDDLLVRIFSLVIGPLKRQEHYINNGIVIRHQFMEPTMVSNFDDLLNLPIVCKRWKDIVQSSVDLWKRAHISAALLRIPRTCKAWLKVFFWISRHSSKIECLHLADESSFRDNSLDGVKMGALAAFTHSLKILHFDHCFHRGANSDLLSILPSMRKLIQLQISSVNHDFIANISALAYLTSLQRLQVQGNGEYWDGNSPVLVLKSNVLPLNLEVLSLANVRVRGFCDMADDLATPLNKLRVLELIYIEWMGPFVLSIAQMASLQKLYVIDCDKIVIDGSLIRQESGWTQLSSCVSLETFVLKNIRYGDFCMHMSHDFSGFAALKNLTELELCPEMAPSVIGLYTFDEEFSQLTALKRLQLVNVGLTELPPSIASLSNLVDLDLTGSKLQTLPSRIICFSWCLTRLVLDSNAFAEVPALNSFSALQELHLSNNPLKFCKDCDYLATLPNMRILRLGNRRLLDVFPIRSASQVDEICKDLRLCPVGGFHLGSLCSSLRYKNPQCRLLM
eukprot:g967.t1